ncbi:unnamed protein product [Symbiodinium necroappetens]|uniref:ASCH domain-containing protein n=1 Tax=Symbiodinium necroappetens TaxID=1628268 RepID=A0A812RWE6_9DINO|nr:unnamed protein product [Symbiodinium necroappetens]
MSPKPRQQIPSSEQLLPQLGDRVLRFQRHWLDLVLAGTKTAEIRRDRTSSGCAWMGCSGRVWGRIHIGDAARLSSLEELRATHGQHRVEATELPYGARTYLWPLSGLYILPEPVPFYNRPGPVTWLPFVPPLQDVHAGSGPAAAGRCQSEAASAPSEPRRLRSRSAPAPRQFPRGGSCMT